jgi:hypothetical protein
MNVKLKPLEHANEDSQKANLRRRPASLGSEHRERTATKDWTDEHGPDREIPTTLIDWRISTNDTLVYIAAPPSQRAAKDGRRVPEGLAAFRRRNNPGRSGAGPLEGSLKAKESAVSSHSFHTESMEFVAKSCATNLNNTDDLVRTASIRNIDEISWHPTTSYTDKKLITEQVSASQIFHMMKSKRDSVKSSDLFSEPSTAVPTEDSLVEIDDSEDEDDDQASIGSSECDTNLDCFSGGEISDELVRSYSIRNIDEISSHPMPSTSKVTQVCAIRTFHMMQSKRDSVAASDLFSEPSTAVPTEDSLVEIDDSEDEDDEISDEFVRTYSIRNIDEITSHPMPSPSKVPQVEPICGSLMLQIPQGSRPMMREQTMDSCGAMESGKNTEDRSSQFINLPTAPKSNRPNTMFARAFSQAR